MFFSALAAGLILELCHTFVGKTRQQQTEMIANIRKGKVRKRSMSRLFKSLLKVWVCGRRAEQWLSVVVPQI